MTCERKQANDRRRFAPNEEVAGKVAAVSAKQAANRDSFGRFRFVT
jgi:hypothetical protein